MAFDNDHLRLTDFMDLPTLQEIQDSFAAVANVRATITDADGNVLTQPQPTSEFLRRQRVIAQTEETVEGGPDAAADGPQRAGREYVAPIVVNNQRLGTLRMSPNGMPAGVDDAKVRRRLLNDFGIEIGAGLGPMKGKAWRVGLMGASSSERNVTLFLAALETILAEELPSFTRGAALGAAAGVYKA